MTSSLSFPERLAIRRFARRPPTTGPCSAWAIAAQSQAPLFIWDFTGNLEVAEVNPGAGATALGRLRVTSIMDTPAAGRSTTGGSTSAPRLRPGDDARILLGAPPNLRSRRQCLAFIATTGAAVVAGRRLSAAGTGQGLA